ncbi:copper-binding protein [Maricaulis sp.]|uniref:copper-binding protein n=1 Tax=Maricaulis sp. TaxID=1486257 RepID=UPI0025C62F20|nr:copper-binding protein [Maricaulis sp.]
MITLLATSLLLATSASEHHGQDHHGGHAMHEAETTAQSVVPADVRTVDNDARTTLLRHEAMPELGMGAMVMPFTVDEAVNIDLFQPGAALIVTVTRGEDGLHIIAAEVDESVG